jgi:hypothetical protein
MTKMHSDFDEFKDLWGRGRADYVLVKSDPTQDRIHLIFNMSKLMAIVIEDDELASGVVLRMLAAGVPVVDKIPEPVG